MTTVRRRQEGVRGNLPDRLAKLTNFGARCTADQLCPNAARTELWWINEDRPEEGEKRGQFCKRHLRFYEAPPLRITKRVEHEPLPQTGNWPTRLKDGR